MKRNVNGSDGILILDKPSGMTSHDVVNRVRRLLGTRTVGHAGTLDPMATGVLVVLVGEATKLSNYCMGQSKRYVTEVILGKSTATLDADSPIQEQVDLSEELRKELMLLRTWPERKSIKDLQKEDWKDCPLVAKAALQELTRVEQVPPAYSAIQVDGRRSYDRARLGETVNLATRTVHVTQLHIGGLSSDWGVSAELEVSKGYYVRSFASDFAANLGTIGHLKTLRRIASGSFTEQEAIGLDVSADYMQLMSLSVAMQRVLPCVTLTALGVRKAQFGQLLEKKDFLKPPRVENATDPLGALDDQGNAVAILRARGTDFACFAVERGFRSSCGVPTKSATLPIL